MAVVAMEDEVEKYSFWDFKGQADYVDSWFLMDKPYLPLFIVISYLLFVLRIGPAYMSGRSPISLRTVLLAYNGFQVVMSVFLFTLGMQNICRYGIFHATCLFHQEDIRKEILSSCYWYVIAKMTELLDTVFFVLRKKQNQVSFLHVYHHTFVFVMSWILVKYAKTDDLIFVGTLNSFIHILMYGYYALSVFPEVSKYLWWKKYLTTMQLVQFVLVLIHFPVNSITSSCPPSNLIVGVTIFNGLFFLHLFTKFYKSAYGTEGKPKSHEKDDSKSIVNGLDDACASFIKNSRSKWKR